MNLFSCIQYLLPKLALTWLVGRLAQSRHRGLKNLLIRAAIARYDINLGEAEHSEVDRYLCFNDFFTRALKQGVRDLSVRPEVFVSPCDGQVSQVGAIKRGRLIQAKGKDYTLAQLLADSTEANGFETEHYFCTLYLSPKDYHRVHVPVASQLTRLTYVPGRLFSVNQKTASGVSNLFARNERLIAYFRSDEGDYVLVMVGALIVAGMETEVTGRIKRGSAIRDLPFAAPRQFEQGEEFGRFYMGSTVILIGQKPFAELGMGAMVRLGQALTHE